MYRASSFLDVQSLFSYISCMRMSCMLCSNNPDVFLRERERETVVTEQQQITVPIIPLRVRFRISTQSARQAQAHQVASRVGELRTVAAEALEVASEGQRHLDRASEGILQAHEAASDSAHAIRRLDESGQQIDAALAELADLAARMHVLAFNAAIEAMRAGEQGQGFAGIAQEIRALTAQGAEVARQVAALLQAIQSEAAATSQGIERSIARIAAQCRHVTQAGMALDAVSIVTEQMACLAQSLGEAASLREDASSPC
jgi:twitching motility protein PilJ